MQNLKEALEHLVPDAKFTIIDNDYSKIQWDTEKYGPIPAYAECQAVQAQADASKQAELKNQDARENINSKYFKAVRELVKFAGGMANAPDALKTMKAQIEALEGDLQGEG